VRFDVAPELRLFGESVRAAMGAWEPAREPDLGAWLDDRDDALASRLAQAGWHELWGADGLDDAVVAGGLELGRAVAPACLVDEATLGAPLAVGGRVRHGAAGETCAVPQPQWGLALASVGKRRHERTLDASGTVVAEIGDPEPLEDAAARWDAWTAATLAYLAGLAAAALDAAVTHARAREQFGQPLAAIPAVQARLADASLAVEGLELTAWQAAVPRETDHETGHETRREPALLWAGAACREVTASAHQVHGAIGFALESGLHRFYRRAKATQVWAAAVCRATTALPRTPAARDGAP
jgi:hypothetical protein